MDYQMIAWIVILILAVVVEIITLGLSSIWFAGGALVALITAALGGPLWLQIVLFVAISVLLLLFTRPIAVKYFNKDRVRTNAESIVGRQGIVLAEVNNLKGVGQVSVGGQEWSARSVNDDQVLEEGSVVEIVAISGVKLICKATAKAPVQVEVSNNQ
ncbi:MAG: NfeD family protein [Lachnospiraceae bacterium]|nr:NfeD family protein [Lachnospiraceae bacterium]MBR3508529.1 NfeD family protein [Lachnospiraceae bacterium]MBR4604955.1 NfeD family protein [Lachnospiraceae bacterium]MBR6151154.1 NfeD family protein [Lachnospiraceae bacterium]